MSKTRVDAFGFLYDVELCGIKVAKWPNRRFNAITFLPAETPGTRACFLVTDLHARDGTRAIVFRGHGRWIVKRILWSSRNMISTPPPVGCLWR